MTLASILKDVNNIYIKILENESVSLTFEDTPNDVEGWDSITQLSLINEIELYFQIKFKLKEVMNFQSIGDICKGIEAKLPK
jgi:acyl carrier protein